MRRAGADADNRQPTARPTDRGGVYHLGRLGDGAGGTAAFYLRHKQPAAPAGGGQRRAFGDAMAADFGKYGG